MKISLLMILFLFSSGVHSQKSKTNVSRVWGKVVEAPDRVQGFQYFVTFKKEEKLYAYPVVIRNEKEREQVKNFVNKLARISGEVGKREVELDGPGKQTVVYFHVDAIEPLSLKELSPQFSELNTFANVPPSERPRQKGMGPASQGGVKLSNQITNIAIAIGGALTIAKMLESSQ